MESLSAIDTWPVDHAATAVVARDGRVLGQHGPQDREFPLASVTKLLSATAILLAVEEGALELDDPAGPEGSTVRHLLAHASGLDFSQDLIRARPGRRRVYSNLGINVLAETFTERAGMQFEDYLREGILEPLGMSSTRLDGPPAAGGVSTVADLSRFVAELQAPRLLHPDTIAEATRVAFPGLDGVLPGFGRQDPNDWGLGFEIRDGKSPHWTGSHNSPETFGHFGQSGTFIWVDPAAGAACVTLTDRDFGAWAAEAWPVFSDGILAELAGA
ncbi:serine hydrolase domain-containing protein [Leucobacter luti]|uniref:CubicO group peptidase (Beta-lactamase class C family) n=1 Tax=Leucobacter luti TaxID=340320 RepID=A0A4Q7TYV0_9MICO|nr:serine hydrolase domain-containing protein [Leucobacter luti]MBL3698966.1 class A beta-lactamase-related serine hydrolase [Leucobacter luti]RZT66344.1 CubicO group peptidase (beta-lactamase class C family) [Leucobacter luti]